MPDRRLRARQYVTLRRDRALLAHPFQLIRLGAYWNRIEPSPGTFNTDELDWQVEAAERAGKQIVLCAGALKTFGYPEFFVPTHRLARPLPEHTLIRPSAYPDLLAAATEFLARIVDRYKGHSSIIAWRVEHEAVDPLGVDALRRSLAMDNNFRRQRHARAAHGDAQSLLQDAHGVHNSCGVHLREHSCADIEPPYISRRGDRDRSHGIKNA